MAINKAGFYVDLATKKIYYYDKNGNKVVNQQKKIGNFWYRFGEKGALFTNGFKSFKNSKGVQKKCYYDINGHRYNKSSKTINGDIRLK